ncbi:unnamed protein product [Hymenolepis diminuta]|uniref:Uncharacterized protein n=1 Tax=Hymenolepis diminuta TaxID=6216 RepID=A0A564Z7S3_HYMDI|nr:unnamed protein product [Hymenolepis diminuta]
MRKLKVLTLQLVAMGLEETDLKMVMEVPWQQQRPLKHPRSHKEWLHSSFLYLLPVLSSINSLCSTSHLLLLNHVFTTPPI